MNDLYLLLLVSVLASLASAFLTYFLLRSGLSKNAQDQTAASARSESLANAAALQLSALRELFASFSQQTPAELARLRDGINQGLALQRQEVGTGLAHSQQEFTQQATQLRNSLSSGLEAFKAQLSSSLHDNQTRTEALRTALETRFENVAQQAHQARLESGVSLTAFREELTAKMTVLSELNAQTLKEMVQQSAKGLSSGLEQSSLTRAETSQTLMQFKTGFSQDIQNLTESNSQKLLDLRTTLEDRLKSLQSDNASKLEAMRQTVDEKLHATLEARLGESFKHVSERLEQVHRGLGEMQTIATGVGDLKRVLSNVKTRGSWGEMQLGNLLEQVLTQEQYGVNVITKPGSSDRVEFAIRLPGSSGDSDTPVWLPIDAKFPREDYERLLDAQDRADIEAAAEAGKCLEQRVKKEAKTIREKYIAPPHTTDFAILFLPTEGLYAEVLRRPGLMDVLQREHRVTIAGPTTLLAVLNSLQMGFKTLAIEKRSSEVWQVLGAVKTEFTKFGEVMNKVKQKLQEATDQIDKTDTRTRAIQRKLRNVELLSEDVTAQLLTTVTPKEDAIDEI